MKGDLYTKAQRLVKIDSIHMWKKCKYPAQIAYKVAGTIIHQQNLGFCLHSSHITGMWKGVLFFGKSKGDILM